MRYIVPCSSCGTELRIPLDLGRLTVRCPRCYHSFVFDPEDSASFRGGRYDSPRQNSESGNPRSMRGFFHFLRETFSKFKAKFRKNEAYGWESPSAQTSSKYSESFSAKRELGPLFAKYLLFALILIGILRACFFSKDNFSPNRQEDPPPFQQEPNPPSQPEEDPPQVEI